MQTLGLSPDYKVDGLIVTGTHPKTKEYPILAEILQQVAPDFVEEKPFAHLFFSDIKSFIVDGKRIWFDVVYGTAYLTEVLHVAALMGSNKNILLGTCGGLRDDENAGDFVIPETSFGNESSNRMYQRDNHSYVYSADRELRDLIKKRIDPSRKVFAGQMVTVQAMLAESAEDVHEWSAAGYTAVDMESSTMFAVSEHFKIPSAALLYVADNLVRNELVGGEVYAAQKETRIMARKEIYKIALEVITSNNETWI